MNKSRERFFPIAITVSIVLVFALGLWGYHEPEYLKSPDDTYYFVDAIYKIFGMFLLAGLDDTDFKNWQVGLASYLAAAILAYGLLSFLWSRVNEWWRSLLIVRFWKGHYILTGNTAAAKQMAKELLQAQEKVVLLEREENRNEQVLAIKNAGATVLTRSNNFEKDLRRAGIDNAAYCLMFTEDDEENLSNTAIISQMNREGTYNRHPLKVLVHVQDRYKQSLLTDYIDRFQRTASFEAKIFNLPQVSARAIYNQHAPLSFTHYAKGSKDESPNAGSYILIIGYKEITLFFLMENIILSHAPGLQNLNITLICKDPESAEKEIRFVYPFIDTYLNLQVMPLHDEHFRHEDYNTEAFHSLLKNLDKAYIFGDHDAFMMRIANGLRQFLYSVRDEIKSPPIVVALPENAQATNLLHNDAEHSGFIATNREELGIELFRTIEDTISKEKLIDEEGTLEAMAKTVNYFYAMKYEFPYVFEQRMGRKLSPTTLQEAEEAFLNCQFTKNHPNPLAKLEHAVLSVISEQTGVPVAQMKPWLTVNTFWVALTEQKKDSNLYVARHFNVKMQFLEKMGHQELHREKITPYFHELAPVEHKRWCAEKEAYHFRLGPLRSGAEKKLLKDTLKIHDQLIPYQELSEEMEDKDFNMFLMLPLLQRMRAVL